MYIVENMDTDVADSNRNQIEIVGKSKARSAISIMKAESLV